MKRLKPNYTRLAACTLGIGLLVPIGQRALATDACDSGFYMANEHRRINWTCHDDPENCGANPLLANMTYKQEAQLVTCYWNSSTGQPYPIPPGYYYQYTKCFGPNRYLQDCCADVEAEAPCPLASDFYNWGDQAGNPA